MIDIKQQAKSDTNKFMVFMAFLQSIATMLATLQPILTIEQFAYASAAIGFITQFGGVFFRNKTTTAIGDK